MDIDDTVFIHMIANVGKLTGAGKSLEGMPIMQKVVAEAKVVEKIDPGTYMVEPVGGGANTPWKKTEDKWWFTRSGAQLALKATNREGVL